MWLTKFFVVLLTLTGRICSSKIAIEISKPDGFAELEEAAINILTTCYADEDKTIVLVGDFPGSFSKRLSSHQSFALALLDNRRRLLKTPLYGYGYNQDTMHKVHIFVIIASLNLRYVDLVQTIMDSPYHNSMASVLVIGWFGENKYAGCDGQWQTVDFLGDINFNGMLNGNLICRDYTRGIVIYGSNPFAKRAPEPWQLVKSIRYDIFPCFTYFLREYRKHEGMCKNLHFDKTHDLCGAPITIHRLCDIPYCSDEGNKKRKTTRRVWLQDNQRFTFIEHFFAHINATIVYKWIPIIKGTWEDFGTHSFQMQPKQLKAMRGSLSYAYPHGVECKFLITQFRGNKSQLQKILSVIDSYSWYGMFMVYVVTLIFFKYFLRQPLLDGILNLFRLTCNFGLTTLPPNVAPRIYLGCLLFFVVTMQGIFVGNLAALLTQDVPIRQVDSIQDLADLGYRVYATERDFMYFNELISKSRITFFPENSDCIGPVLRDPLIACFEWGADAIDAVSKHNLHRSPGCLAIEYVTNIVPWQWMLEERLKSFLGILIGGSIMISLEARVVEIRMLEAESQKVLVEPRIMVFNDLAFAFKILGIGLGLAIVVFIIEIIIYRFRRRVRTTRAIVLN